MIDRPVGVRSWGFWGRWVLACVVAGLAGGVAAQATPPKPEPQAEAPDAAPLSATARRLFDASRANLVQVRTLLAQQDSQASVGSGFVVEASGLLVSNYHVVSQAALEPQRYRLRFKTADGRQGKLQIVAIDVRRDLALLRAVGERDEPLTWPAPLSFRPAQEPLAKGDRIYSLGHPHDVAFAIVEGNYNGLVERSFDDLIYYAGALNPGMSGGPVLDDRGRVVAVNVSTMLFSQQMSFLIPGRFAEGLWQRSREAKPLTGPAWPQVRDQLLGYTDELVQAFMAQAWGDWGHAHYRMPIPEEQFLRCWGRSADPRSKGLQFSRSQCRQDHALFVGEGLETGYLEVQHEVYDGKALGAWRFARQYSQSFRNENLGRANDRHRTAPHCSESFIDAQGLPARAVVCLKAYRKMPGVHDVTVLITAVDRETEGLLGRFDARGVRFESALKLARHFIAGYGRKGGQS
ncbi:S1 family peptidase [Inhella gelatinilytica]|uniref:Trypsin-like peptidase domain-containing protein n=1 Tax=Inhella gelatinilytica TaxID=2795030 RepID=A0A931IYV6_9BURK|nr:serine protease [Inhella gelatinilytica]MBH9552346.1 trypsin-like peptidase domain-containing protein [Inhella gelatinilytica]